MGFLNRHPRAEADATITHVQMTKRIDYGDAKVLVTYQVRPGDAEAFETQIEAKVKMATLPQVGQEVRVAYDPNRHDRLDVLTPPGQESGTVTEKTAELEWDDPQPRVMSTQGEVQRLRDQVFELEQQQQRLQEQQQQHEAPPEGQQ
jgi:hypothetical protein